MRNICTYGVRKIPLRMATDLIKIGRSFPYRSVLLRANTNENAIYDSHLPVRIAQFAPFLFE
jgi:hypothetical protein